MKYFSQILSLTTVIALMITFQSATAQSDIDTNQMNRDIKIMEKVLGEMFKYSAVGNYASASLELNNIKGKYLPDYGVIFTIPHKKVPGPIVIKTSNNDDKEEVAFNFEYSDNTDDGRVTKESVTNKIIEFLGKYGSNIDQLSNDQNVTVIYKSQTTDRRFTVFRSDDDNEKNSRKTLPTIYVMAKVDDLKDYRSGDISDNEFYDRLDITTTDSSAGREKDLKVMANILETAFEESNEKTFRIAGSVDYLYLDSFGVLFFCKARSGRSLISRFSSISHSLDQSDFNSIDLSKEGNVIVTTKDGEKTLYDHKGKKIGEESQKQREQYKKQLYENYQRFVADLKKYVVDYGKTLKSVDSNQYILVSVKLNTFDDNIPEWIDLQVQKSVLENMNPEEAIKKISVREY